MSLKLSKEMVWRAIEGQLFAVLGMVTGRGESRTVGVVYIVDQEKLYVGTRVDSWKARHILLNPSVSMTIPIPKRIPFLPWIKIPAATVSFSGMARMLRPFEIDAALLRALFHRTAEDKEALKDLCIIEIEPIKDFLTYGVGVTLLGMRDPEQARGRVATAALSQAVSKAG